MAASRIVADLDAPDAGADAGKCMRTDTMPSWSCTRAHRSARTPCKMSALAGSSNSTGRHGPTAWTGGHHPGIWPSSVVRTARSWGGTIIRGFHRTGPRCLRNHGSRARKQTYSKLSPTRSTSTSWATNMCRVLSTSFAFSQTSAIVARPLKRNTRRPRPENAARYQWSCACKGGGAASSQRPAARSALATVPGTGAGSHPASGCSSEGCFAAPAAVCTHDHSPSSAALLTAIPGRGTGTACPTGAGPVSRKFCNIMGPPSRRIRCPPARRARAAAMSPDRNHGDAAAQASGARSRSRRTPYGPARRPPCAMAMHGRNGPCGS